MRNDPRHTPDEEGGSHERWLVSYADFITLMFAFFAVLYATSEKDLEKTKEFQDSVKKYLIKAGAFGDSGQQINQGNKHNTVIEQPIQTFQQVKAEAADTLDKTETFIESKFNETDRKKYILDVSADEWGVRITLANEALFPSGSERFHGEAVKFVEKLSAVLTEAKRKVVIEGHVSKNETGSFKSTWDFSSARAVNLLRFMQKTQGFPEKMLAAMSFGDSRPLYEGPQASMNSRLEIVLLNQDLDL